MPIRFRCEHCNQLMGIARRKAGTRVNCPTCRNDVLVPYEDGPSLPEPEPIRPPQQPAGLFDRDDFDALLAGNGAAHGRGVAQSAPPGASGLALTGANAWPTQQSQSQPPAGIVLSPGRATLLTVVLIFLLAVSFVAGLLVGRFAL